MNMVKWDLFLHILIKHKMKEHREECQIICITGPLYHMTWEEVWYAFVLVSDMC